MFGKRSDTPRCADRHRRVGGENDPGGQLILVQWCSLRAKTDFGHLQRDGRRRVRSVI